MEFCYNIDLEKVCTLTLTYPVLLTYQPFPDSEWGMAVFLYKIKAAKRVPAILKELLRYERQEHLRSMRESVITYVAASAIENFIICPE